MTILDDIARYKREEIAQAKARLPQLALEETAKAIDAPRGTPATITAAHAAANA